MAKPKRAAPKRRHEFVDPNPLTLPVKFQRPPTLPEQIARYMAAHHRYVASQGGETVDEMNDFDEVDEDSPPSPHELVFDPLINREIPRFEKEMLERGRARFDAHLNEKIQKDREAAVAAQKASEHYAAKQQKKAKKIVDPAPLEDE